MSVVPTAERRPQQSRSRSSQAAASNRWRVAHSGTREASHSDDRTGAVQSAERHEQTDRREVVYLLLRTTRSTRSPLDSTPPPRLLTLRYIYFAPLSLWSIILLLYYCLSHSITFHHLKLMEVSYMQLTFPLFIRINIFNVSIEWVVGYSTCQMCHVMERESFEIENGRVLNENFVLIEFDSEERRDVDRVYMNFLLVHNLQYFHWNPWFLFYPWNYYLIFVRWDSEGTIKCDYFLQKRRRHRQRPRRTHRQLASLVGLRVRAVDRRWSRCCWHAIDGARRHSRPRRTGLHSFLWSALSSRSGERGRVLEITSNYLDI